MTQKNILIVDDDERLRDLLKDYLTEKKLNVYISDDFENARDVIQYFIFDLIILDRMMPSGDGIELIEFIKKLSNTPVIMLTAMGDDKDKIDGLKIGAAFGDDNTSATAGESKSTMYAVYTFDAFSVGFQASENDSETASSDVDFGRSTILPVSRYTARLLSIIARPHEPRHPRHVKQARGSGSERAPGWLHDRAVVDLRH